MKIDIDNLQNQDLLTEVNSSTGKSILGGDSIESSFKVVASSNNAEGGASGGFFGFGNDLFASLKVDVKTGEGFSRSSSFITMTSN